MISFFLTTKCNLCCRYCYNAKERNAISEQTLDLDIAKAGIDWYFANNDSRHIRFYGPGEPTQEFDKLVSITEYAKSHPNRGKDVTVEIQTNGVFTETIRSWILSNVDIIWLSFDGMKEIQNYNRPLNPMYKDLYGGRTSAEILEDNAKWLIDNRGKHNLMVGARVTITDLNIDKQIDMIDYFSSLGIRYVWTNPLFYAVGKKPVDRDEEKKKNYHFDMNRYLKKYISAYQYGKTKGFFWGSFLAINFDGNSDYNCRCCTPLCAPHLTPDGYISACDLVVLGSQPYHMSPFVVGRWDEEKHEFIFDYEKIKILNERKSSNMKHCQNCPVQMHCGGYCLGEIVNETGSLYGQNKIKCNAVQRLYKELGQSGTYKYFHP